MVDPANPRRYTYTVTPRAPRDILLHIINESYENLAGVRGPLYPTNPSDGNNLRIEYYVSPSTADDTAEGDQNAGTISGNVLTGGTGADTGRKLRVLRYWFGVNSGDTTVLRPNPLDGDHGRLVITEQGAFTYTVFSSNSSLAAGKSNMDVFTYRVRDSKDVEVTGTLSITVTGVNDLPTLAEETVPAPDKETSEAGGVNNMVAGDTVGRGKLNANDVDDGAVVAIQGRRVQPQGQWLTGADSGSAPATVIDGRFGELTLGADGTWTYALDDDRAATNELGSSVDGADAFDFRASDGTGFSTPLVQVEIEVGGNNDAPSFENAIPAQTATKGQPFSYQIPANTFADPDTATLRYRARQEDGSDLPDWLKGGISVSGRLSSTNVPDNAPASLSIVVLADDSIAPEVAATAFTLRIRGVGDALAVNDTLKISEERGGNVGFNVIAGTGFGDTGGGVDTGTGLTVTRYWVGDNTDGRATPVPVLLRGPFGRLQITVDGAGRFNLAEGNPAINGLAADEDLDVVFTYEIVDANGATDTATLTITVTGVDDAPEALRDSGRVSEDGPSLMVAAPGVLGNDSGTDLTVTRFGTITAFTTAPTPAGTALTTNFGVLTLQANGSHTYAPATSNNTLAVNEVNRDHFIYEVSAVEVVDGTPKPAVLLTADLTITITGVNDAPTIASLVNTGTVTEAGVDAQGMPVAGTPSATGASSISDPDTRDNNRLQVRFDGGPWVTAATNFGGIVQGDYGELGLSPAQWRYTLDNDRVATAALTAGGSALDVFEFRAWDGRAASATQTVTITVNGTNDAPEARKDAGRVSEDGPSLMVVAPGVLGNDSGTELTVTRFGTNSSFASAPTPTGTALTTSFGVLTLQANGSYTYAPATSNNALAVNEVNRDNFIYEMSAVEVVGGTPKPAVLLTAGLTITITGVNDAPTVVGDGIGDQSVTVGEYFDYRILSLDASGAEFADVDAASLNYTLTSTSMHPAWVRLSVAGHFSGLATTATVGTHNVVVRATDEGGLWVEDSFTLTIRDPAVVAVDDRAEGTEDAGTITGNVIAGDAANANAGADTGTGLSVTRYGEGPRLRPQAARPPNPVEGLYGSLVITAQGAFTYTVADLNTAGVNIDRFIYEVSNGTERDTAALIITVTGVNDLPTLTEETVPAPDKETSEAGGSNNAVAGDTVGRGKLNANDVDDGAVVTIQGRRAQPQGQWLTGADSGGAPGTVIDGRFGELTFGADGTWTYALDDDRAATDAIGSGVTAADAFDFRASDGTGFSTPLVQVEINVTGSNDVPTANPDPNPTVVVVGGPGLNVAAADGVLANDTDPDADDIPSTFAVVSYRSTVESSMTSTVGMAAMGHYGTVIIMADGSYTYTPGGATAAHLLSSTTASEFFTYRMQDGDGATADSTLRIRVRGSSTQPTLTVSNMAPDVKESGVTPTGGVEDGAASATGTVTAVGGIVQGVAGAGTAWRSATTAGVTIPGTYGDLSLRLDGWTYTLANDRMATNALAVNASAQDIFRVRATNAIGTANPVTVTVAVAGTNDAPVVGAAIPARTIVRDGAFAAFSVPTDAFTDPESDPLTYTAALEGGGGLPTWLVLSTGGEFTSNGSVPSNAPSSLSIVVTAADDKDGRTAAAAFTLTIAVNSGPVEVNAIADVAIDEDAAWAFTFPAADETNNVFSDPDGHALTYSSMQVVSGTQQALPAWLVQGRTGRTFSGTPRDADVGPITIRVTATDTGGLTAITNFDVTVRNTNDAPTEGNGIDDVAIDEDVAWMFTFPDTGDANNAFADPDGDTLTYTAMQVVSGMQQALPAWLVQGSTGRTFSGTPRDADIGTITIRVTARDPSGRTGATDFDVTVRNTNDAPTVEVTHTDSTVREPGVGQTADLSANGTIVVDDVDMTGQTLTVEGAAGPVGAVAVWMPATTGGAEINGRYGRLTLRPDRWSYALDPDRANRLALGRVENDRFKVRASDGTAQSEQRTITIQVEGSNDAPAVGVAIPDRTAARRATLPSFPVPANAFRDPEGDTLRYQARLVVNGVAQALPTWLSFNQASGVFTNNGTVPESAPDALVIEVTANDGKGGMSEGSRFTLTITKGANRAPEADNEISTRRLDEDAPWTYTIPDTGDANNVFSDPDGDTLVYSALQRERGTSNTLALPDWLDFTPSARTFTGMPLNEHVGQIVLQVMATDPDGLTETTAFDVIISNTNDAPSFALADAPDTEVRERGMDARGVRVGDPLAGGQGGGALTLTDPDPAPHLGLIAQGRAGASGAWMDGMYNNGGAVLTGAYGDLTLTTRRWSYRLDDERVATNALVEGASMNDTFQLRAWDGSLASEPVTLTIAVEGSDDRPTSDGGSVSVNEGSTHTFAATDFDFMDVDANSQLQSISITSLPSAVFGSVALSGSALGALPLPLEIPASQIGSLVFTPVNRTQNYTTRLRFTVSDGTLSSTPEATMTIAVTATDEDPTVEASAFQTRSVLQETRFFLNISGAFMDPEGLALAYSAVQVNNGIESPLPDWLELNTARGTFFGTPSNEHVGTLTIRVRATDPGGNMGSDEFVLLVRERNDPPTVNAALADVTIDEDAPWTFMFLDIGDANSVFSDPDVGDTLIYAAALANGNALSTTWLTFDPSTRTFSGTPRNEHVGTLTIRVTATDTGGLPATDDFDVTVRNTNDAPVFAGTSQNLDSSQNILFRHRFPQDHFTDEDVGDTLIWDVTLADGNARPAWLDFDGDARTLSGTPPTASAAVDLALRVTVTDSGGATAMDDFMLHVGLAPNVSPVAADDTATTDEDAASASGNVISGDPNDNDAGQDRDPDDTGTLVVTLFNEGARIDETNGMAAGGTLTLSGDRGALQLGANGAWTFTVGNAHQSLSAGRSNRMVFSYRIVDDRAGRDDATLTVIVEGRDDAPRLAREIPDQYGGVGELFTYTVPADTFTDQDANDTQVLTATLADGNDLPAWLGFTSGAFRGTPPAGMPEHLDIRVTVTSGGVMRSDEFRLHVEPAGTPVVSISEFNVPQRVLNGREISITFARTGDTAGGLQSYFRIRSAGYTTNNIFSAAFLADGPTVTVTVRIPSNAVSTDEAARLIVLARNDPAVTSRVPPPGQYRPGSGTGLSRDFTLAAANRAPVPVEEGRRNIPDAVVGQEYGLDLNGMFDDFEGDDLMFSLPSRGGTGGGCDMAFALEGDRLVGSGMDRVIPLDTIPGIKECEVTASDGALQATTVLRIRVAPDTDAREVVRNVLAVVARTMGWDAVDAIRKRAALDGGTGSSMDLSGLMNYVRDMAMKRSTDSGGQETGELLAHLMERKDADAEAGLGASASHGGSTAGGAGYSGAAGYGSGSGKRFWANATHSSMNTDTGGFTYDGDLTTMRAGVEKQYESTLLGVAINRTWGDIKFSGDSALGGGSTDFRQWGLTPYMSRENGAMRTWGLLGLGAGTLDYEQGEGASRMAASSDTQSYMAALGLEYRRPGQSIDIVGRVEGMVSGLDVDANDLYDDVSVWTRGARGQVEVSLPQRSVTSSWRPYALAGWRWDAGAGESGNALEYGGGIEMTGTDLTLTFEARGESGGELDRTSYSLDLSFDAGRDARGVTAKVTSKYGADRKDPFTQTFEYGNETSSGSDTLGLELGYGVSVWEGLLTPYIEADLNGGSFSAARLGFTFIHGPASISFEHGLTSSSGSTQDEHELTLTGEIRF